MSQLALVVEKDVVFFEKEKSDWEKRGIDAVRVDYMQEAIEIVNKNLFLFIAINADNINYMPMLRMLREVFSIPILLFATEPPDVKETEALNQGADAFITFRNGTDKNVELAMAHVRRYTERSNQVKKPPRTLSYGNLIMFYDYRYVFCNDAEIEMTKKEFDMLYLFFSNPNISLEFGLISRKVWCDDYADVSSNSVWQQINKIRKKLEKAKFNGGIIKNIRDVGYRFSPQYPH